MTTEVLTRTILLLALPVARGATGYEEDGRGLLLLDALADSWGARPLPTGGKAIWFVLRAS